jgi:aryl-alcohol dehydrogenase-like predicted oxidoreductase
MTGQGTLTRDGLVSTRLGFGCAALIGGRTRQESLRLLDAAYDAGIRHFDVARVYGTGDAEAVVGEFARGRRDQIAIATKFGIAPPAASTSMAVAKRVVRTVSRRSQRVVKLVRRYAPSTSIRSQFDPNSALASLRTSLRELQTDHVDLLLLHDCAPADWERQDLQSVLREQRAAGAVRAYGPASEFPQVREILLGAAPSPAVAQFGGNGVERQAETLREVAGTTELITFRPFEPLSSLKRTLGDPDVVSRWQRALGIDLRPPEVLPRLLLASALEANPAGTVLFSASTAGQVQANARLLHERPFEASQLSEFARLAREIAQAPTRR